jgi:hypothetical protein
MPSEIIVNSDESLESAIDLLRYLYGRHRYFSFTPKFGRARSLTQNAISHVWYEQVAQVIGDDDARGVKRFCKLHFGVPILRAEDADFREAYDAAIKGLTYEQKLIAMDILPVTSIMTTRQLSQYMGEVQEHYDKQGIKLEFPKDEQSEKRKRNHA